LFHAVNFLKKNIVFLQLRPTAVVLCQCLGHRVIDRKRRKRIWWWQFWVTFVRRSEMSNVRKCNRR